MTHTAAPTALRDHTTTIARSYGLGSPTADPVLAARGEQGRVWRLDTTSGSFAVKELLVRERERDAAGDVAYQQTVRRAGTVPMPRPVPRASGEVLLDVAEHQVRVYEWVDLLPRDSGLDPVMVGETVAAVHRIHHVPSRPLHSWFTDPVGATRWAELLAAAQSARAPFAEAFRAEIPTLLQLEELIEPPTRLQSCHRDLWSDNVLPTVAGGLCVIDWENCGLEDPAQEIPMVLLDFASGSEARARTLYESYVDAGGPARVQGRGCFTMVIAQFGHFWEAAVRAYASPGATPDTQQHSIDRVRELLDIPLTVELIDAVLDSLAAVR